MKSFNSIDLINMFESEECDIAESDGYECTFGFSMSKVTEIIKEYEQQLEESGSEEESIPTGWRKIDYAEEQDGRLIPNYECSACKNWARKNTTYCPNCGHHVSTNVIEPASN